ncbi:unnamed protein product [Schistocephalus solidus]|uniref:Uncharacterized protein n=1 Tax=Schistocephalus solidus TaxID=70667 RepID=A0A3P7CSP8_SCHSO|nr:unnamed protein product [Schistocephalus solidus]
MLFSQLAPRCFDLSYESSLPTAESSECSRQKIARANPSSPSQLPQQMILDYQLPTLFGNRLMRPAFRRRILPGNRLPRSASEDRTGIPFSIEVLVSPHPIAVQQLSSEKAPGSDAIPPQVYKRGGPRLIAKPKTNFRCGAENKFLTISRTQPSFICTSRKGAGNSDITKEASGWQPSPERSSLAFFQLVSTTI